MKIIHTHERTPGDLSAWEQDQVYNGLDCCVTREVFDAIHPQLDNATSSTYDLSRALQGPVLEMRLRGVRVDLRRRAEVLDSYFDRLDRLGTQLETIALDGIGMEKFNWASNADLKTLFYDKLQIPAIRSKGHVSVDVHALEKLRAYLIAQPLVSHLTALRELQKRIAFLRTPLDNDHRMRTSYNIAGTETGRFSSSVSEFGAGTNLQNVEELMRTIFIPDPGMKFAKFDAKSGESYVVGAIEWNLFRDPRYLDAVESGDIHTAVARLCWPTQLPWTGALAADKEIAERLFYRHYSYRFMCKKLGHGSNYGGKAASLAIQSHLPVGLVTRFQPLYFAAFPAHQLWQQHVADTLLRYGQLTTLTGRRRHFHGRRNEDATVREAIAFDPQGSLADIVNNGMLNVWRANVCQIMMHDHDAITVQYPEEREDEIVPRIQKLLEYPIVLAGDRAMTIPYDAEVGWNKGHYDAETNPQGLKAYAKGDKRRRQKETHLLDRKVL